MKQLFLLCMAFALLIPAFPCAAEASSGDDGSIRLSLTAVEATRLMGNGINLGNTMEACDYTRGNFAADPTVYETYWGQPVTTQDMLTAMKAAGFDTIRIPVAWMTNATAMPYAMKDYTISEAYLARVREIVDYARNADMYVILNDHWDGGWWGMFGSEDPDTVSFAIEAYCGMWKQIAEYFRDYSDYVIFESANEELGSSFDQNSPCYCKDSVANYLSDNEKYALANRINQAFVDTVRAVGGNNAQRFLLIAGYNTNIDYTFDSRFKMPADSAEKKLMISVHYYDPWSYCGASSAAGATLWGKAADFEGMYRTLSKMSKFVKQGYGVVIGEYGALPGSDNVMKKNAPAYHKAFLDCCDALDFTSCLWDCSGFFVRRKLTIAEPEMAAVYAGRNAASEAAKDYALIAEAGKKAVEEAAANAPATLREDALQVSEGASVAWIMFSEGSWALSYSVGDVYSPDSITPGIVPTDVKITGPGEYTVALDFAGTEKGYAENTAFSAVGISNGEMNFPGYCIQITDLKINGESVRLKGRNYTCSDDGKCTRTNLFNEWVNMKGVNQSNARVPIGDLTGISATLLDRSLPAMNRIESLSVTFTYAPRK
ncbi:MAG: glycoside hydrolase family 5 protein [Clostridia bacterium]|nr:glycoside hydrolase family 5 protein [Clostridia bacterium]MBR4537472.1 glycoside hydrolase family 5 protein [Clostridia bacterium]